MNEAHLAVIISVVSLAGQALNAFLKHKMRADLAEFETRMVERIGNLDGRFVQTKVFEREIYRLDQRCADRHG